MKRKFKLLASISAFALCMAMLVFGVYSASTVNYTSSGTIRYTVKDVFVEIHTKVYRSSVNTTKTQNELNATQSALESSSNLATTATAQNLVDMNYGISIEEVGGENVEVDATELKSYTSNSITSPNATLSKTLNDFAFEYDEYDANNTKSYAYYIVVTVENNGNASVGVTATLSIPDSSNTLSKATGNKNIAASGTQNFVFATALDDPMLEVNTTFSYALSIGKNAVEEEVVYTVPETVKTLSNCTPAEIKAVALNGEVDANDSTKWVVGGTEWFSIGDTVTMTLTNNKSVVLELAGFNHDIDAEDNTKTLPFTFVTKYVFEDAHRMNSTATNVGGWPLCEMRSYLNDENDANSIYSLMPDAWKSLVKAAKKTTVVGGSSPSTVETSNDKLFLLSVKEVGCTLPSPYTLEGTPYPLFQSDSDRNKDLPTGQYGISWWLRSPGPGDNGKTGREDDGFYMIYSSGGANSVEANQNGIGACGIVFGFCI